MMTYKLSEIEYLRVLGRSEMDEEGLNLFWTASGIEFQLKGSEAWAHLYSDYTDLELWVDVLVDDAPVQRLMLPKGEYDLCLFRGMNPEESKNVKLLRDIQAMRDDSAMRLQIRSITVEGSLEPLPDKDMKLEFIGDSITSGEGCTGADNLMDWIPLCFSCINNYAFMTACALNAEYRSLSQSGWGVHCSWDANTENVLPKVYTKVCGVLKGEVNERLGAAGEWDFSRWKPDAVIVNLGANDLFGMTASGEDPEVFVPEAKAFLRLIREKNPNTYIIWAYGMLAPELLPYVMKAVREYGKETGDERAEFLPLPMTLPDQFGARQHPGTISHGNTAKVLTARLQELRREGRL